MKTGKIKEIFLKFGKKNVVFPWHGSRFIESGTNVAYAVLFKRYKQNHPNEKITQKFVFDFMKTVDENSDEFKRLCRNKKM